MRAAAAAAPAAPPSAAAAPFGSGAAAAFNRSSGSFRFAGATAQGRASASGGGVGGVRSARRELSAQFEARPGARSAPPSARRAAAEAARLAALARASEGVTAELEVGLRQWCDTFPVGQRDGGDLSAFVHAIGSSRRTTKGLLSARDEVLALAAAAEIR
ncbi:hypothetical protein T492DRAFT_863605 [Pavlovales sp. CCMP2436]|nr:hypothetical protein T492DRAFT_863605 [Pavlovales sp. CCMP2436]